MTAKERRNRNGQMCYERMKGLTIRQIAKRHGLSKSQVHRVVGECEILPPPLAYSVELVRLPSGAYSWRHGQPIPTGQRAYKVRDHRRLYAGMA